MKFRRALLPLSSGYCEDEGRNVSSETNARPSNKSKTQKTSDINFCYSENIEAYTAPMESNVSSN
jgi:hypothetical protein